MKSSEVFSFACAFGLLAFAFTIVCLSAKFHALYVLHRSKARFEKLARDSYKKDLAIYDQEAVYRQESREEDSPYFYGSSEDFGNIQRKRLQIAENNYKARIHGRVVSTLHTEPGAHRLRKKPDENISRPTPKRPSSARKLDFGDAGKAKLATQKSVQTDDQSHVERICNVAAL